MGRDFLGPVGSYQHDRQAAGLPRQVVDDLQGGIVRGMQVLQAQQHRLTGGKDSQAAMNGPEQSSGIWRGTFRRAAPARVIAKLGDNGLQIDNELTKLRPEAIGRQSQQIVAEGIADWTVWCRALLIETATRETEIPHRP